MLGDPRTRLDLTVPRKISEIVRTALQLYARHALLFIFLAGIVVVPYEVIVVLVVHGQSKVKLGTELVLLLIELALVDPFIAALQVQALLNLGAGERPSVTDVIRRATMVLPAVAAADIVAGIGIGIGAVAFVIPGVILALRWAVVAPVAAAERTDWPTALRRSAELTRRNYWRILALIVIVGVLNNVAGQVTGTGKHLGTTLIGIFLAIIVHSLGSLLVTLLYFDLRARESAPVA